MKTTITGNYGSSGVVSSLTANGTQNEIIKFAESKQIQGYKVTINTPSANRDNWQANAQLSGKQASELKVFGISKVN